jgi:hypothetical protein
MSYIVVPIVVGEGHKEHISAQVIEPMLAQLETGGPDRPASAIVVLIEAARVAVSSSTGRRVGRLARRVPGMRALLWPIVNRFGLRVNAWLLAARLRMLVGRRAVVFQCRGEDAVEWATALQQHVSHAGIVADIRGWTLLYLARQILARVVYRLNRRMMHVEERRFLTGEMTVSAEFNTAERNSTMRNQYDWSRRGRSGRSRRRCSGELAPERGSVVCAALLAVGYGTSARDWKTFARGRGTRSMFGSGRTRRQLAE